MTDTTAPTFEGRPLPKPDELVVDQGLQFDITTLMARRGLLKLLGGSLGAISLAACGVDPGSSASPSATEASSASGTGTAGSTAAASDLTEIPDETAGPYPGDGSNGPDVLEQSGVVRSDIRSSFGSSTTIAEGVPLTVEFTVFDVANGNIPFTGVAVYAWHCNREGEYSMYSSGLEDENYLRGVQIADDDGKVTFTSVFPGCYSGRWPHIHFEVYPDEASITDATNAIATSQLALPQASCDAVYATEGYESSVTNLARISLTTDNVFGEDGGESQLATMSGDVTGGYVATLNVGVDTTTEPTSGSAPSAPGGDGRPSGAPPQP